VLPLDLNMAVCFGVVLGSLLAVSILDLCSVFLVSQRSPDFLFLFVLLAPGAWVFGRRPGGVTRTQGHPPQAADWFSS
jgi:hypothetical protein